MDLATTQMNIIMQNASELYSVVKTHIMCDYLRDIVLDTNITLSYHLIHSFHIDSINSGKHQVKLGNPSDLFLNIEGK